MGILDGVTSGTPPMGIRMVVAAGEKIGKTTFCCDAPEALLIPMEQGYGGIAATKTQMITAWPQAHALMDEIARAAQAGKFRFKSLVWDSASALEALIHAHTIALDPAAKGNKTVTMESAHGGYGKAYGVADGMFRTFLAFGDYMAMNFGVNTIITCHVFASKVMDPQNGEYHSWDLQLHSPRNEKTFGKREIIAQWADVIGFLHQPTVVVKKDGLQQAVGTSNDRALALERSPSYVAGNRYGIRGVLPIPAPPANGWNHFAHALYQARGIDVFNRAKP